MIDRPGLESIQSQWDPLAEGYPVGSAESLVADIGLRYQFATIGGRQVIAIGPWHPSPKRPTLVIERAFWDAVTEAATRSSGLVNA